MLLLLLLLLMTTWWLWCLLLLVVVVEGKFVRRVFIQKYLRRTSYVRHSNSQLFRLRLNCSPGARTTNVRGKTVSSWGSGNAEAAAAEASCQCAGDDKVAVISRPQSWSCRHSVHTSRRYFGHRPWWTSNDISAIWRRHGAVLSAASATCLGVLTWCILVISRAAACRTDCSRRWMPSATY